MTKITVGQRHICCQESQYTICSTFAWSWGSACGEWGRCSNASCTTYDTVSHGMPKEKCRPTHFFCAMFCRPKKNRFGQKRCPIRNETRARVQQINTCCQSKSGKKQHGMALEPFYLRIDVRNGLCYISRPGNGC